ncbi:MAG: hypothetical protein ACOWYE_00590 [Desulfatiglandales bacterium]
MAWIETIHLRTYSQGDRDEAISAFRQLGTPDREKSLGEIVLFRDFSLANDLCLFIHWNGEVPGKGKSPLGLQLAAAFSPFGQVNHCLWVQEGSVPLKGRRSKDEEQV